MDNEDKRYQPRFLHVEKKKTLQEKEDEEREREEKQHLHSLHRYAVPGSNVPGVGKVVRQGSRYFSILKGQKHGLDIIRNAYQEPIGAPVFHPGLYNEIKNQVLNSKEVQEEIAEFRSQNPNKSKEFAMAKAISHIDRLAANYEEKSLRAFAFIVQNVLSQLYNGIHLSQKEMSRVKDIAIKAQAEGIPLVLLPTHKSHIDYLVVSYVFLICNLSLPFIAAGDNLMMPIVGTLLRRSGAFFIKRKFDDDKIYRAVFDEYIRAILSKGYNLEFFLEGGRSRTGKLLKPKMGILNIITEACLKGQIKDAYLVPVSIGYDKVIETEQYVTELLGVPKEKESIGALLRSTQLLKFNFGRIDLRIAQPFSLKSYLNEETVKRNLDPKHKVGDLRILTQVLAYSILYKINKVSVTLPTAIVVSVLLTHRGRGISRRDLITKFEWLREEIKKRGGKVATPDTPFANTGQLIDTALVVLGNLVTKQKNVLEPILTPSKRFELSYYRNQILHLFMNEGLIACALYSRVHLSSDHAVLFQDLLRDVTFLSQLLKMEIVYLPSPDIKLTIEHTIQEMVDRGIICINTPINNNESNNNSIKINNASNKGEITTTSDGSVSVVPGSIKTVSISPSGIEQFDFLCALFWPFIDAYWLLCSSFYALYPTNMSEEKTYIQKVQTLGFTLYYQGELSYYESVSKDTLTNSLQLFITIGVIEKVVVNTTGLAVLKLTREYQNGDLLVNLIETIGRMRREGKYSIHQSKFSSKLKEIIQLVQKSPAKL